MKHKPDPTPRFETIEVEQMARAILSIQRPSGEIPWSEGGKTDPWDHVESAMGLSVAGFDREARHAYGWLCDIQLEDGALWASFKDGQPDDRRKDANMTAYVAVGVFHHFLVTGDQSFLERMWPCVSRAVDFAVSLQAPDGQIYWSMDEKGVVDKVALLTGSSSIYLSIRCALAIAARLKKTRPQWEFALRKLGKAIRHRAHLFDETKSRYSMDWYYPILCGAVTGAEAHDRFDGHWDAFVVPNWGSRCVSDRPWVTMAESSELVLALTAAGRHEEAELIFSWIRGSRYDDGFYWTGLTVPDSVIWPEERTSWTTAAVILAGDALYGWTAGSDVFSHAFWEIPRGDAGLSSQRERIAAG